MWCNTALLPTTELIKRGTSILSWHQDDKWYGCFPNHVKESMKAGVENMLSLIQGLTEIEGVRAVLMEYC